MQIKIHLCLLNCFLKWLPPTVTAEYYAVIYALTGIGTITWILKSEYIESTFPAPPPPLVLSSLSVKFRFEFLVKGSLILTSEW